jgi:hypothetical protein
MLLISEVMYDPESAEPDGEWIEIYNPHNFSIPLSAFKLGDEEAAGGGEGMYRFPKNALIPPRKVVVVANRAISFFATYGFLPDFEFKESDGDDPDMVKYVSWAGGNVELVNAGDEVVILGARDVQVDALSWGGSAHAFDPPVSNVASGYSVGRVPANRDTDTAMDWQGMASPRPGSVDLSTLTPSPIQTGTEEVTPSITPTPGPSPTPTLDPSPTPISEPFLISEVLYDPAGEEPEGEWVEIYNPGSEMITLAEFKIGDEETPGGGEGMCRFPSEDAVINPGQVNVIANQGSIFNAHYGFPPDYEFNDTEPSVPDMIKHTDWAGGTLSLGNSGEDLLILDPVDQVVDALSWGPSEYAFTPAAPDVGEGHSLERVPANQDNDTAGDWQNRDLPDPGGVTLLSSTATPSCSPTLTVTPTTSSTPEMTMNPTPAEETPTPVTEIMTPTPSDDPGVHALISEVFYDTPGIDSQEEWYEINNPTGSVIDLSNYKPGDEETQGGGEGMGQFPPGAILEPGGVIVVGLRADGFISL